MHEGSTSADLQKTLRMKIFVGALVLASFVGLPALASGKNVVTAVGDTINFYQTSQCPGGWKDLDSMYLKDFASGPNGGGLQFNQSEAAKRACETEPSCSGVTCDSSGCTLRKGDQEVSPFHEFSHLCMGKVPHPPSVREVVEFANHADEVSGAIRWNNFCFDIQDGRAENGANLQIWGCEQGGQHDNRRFIHGTNGTVRWAAHPEFCFDVQDGWSGNGANIQLWQCAEDGESPNQQFIFPSPGSRGKIRWASHPSKCFDIAGGRKQNGNNVGTWECDDVNENPNQHFKISNGIAPEEVASAEDGGKITGAIRWNNFCLDVKDGWADNGANIHTWECEGENNNNRFIYGTGTSAIRWAAHPELCFDVKDGWHGDGANIQLWQCADGVSPNQLFILPALGMRGRIQWAANQSKCLDVAGGWRINGTNIQTWRCDDTKENPNQMFRLASGMATR